MSALVRKEFRLLLPAWIAALVAATLPLWFRQNLLWAPFFGLMAMFLGLAPFGQELSCGTFGLLLSQPEKRRRFWRIKTGLLALALLSAWALFALCCSIGWRHLEPWQLNELGSFPEMAGVSGLLALLVFSGGLWTTLLLRDVTTAFFITVLFPLGIFSGTILCMACVSGWDEVDCMITCWPLAIYAVAGFFVARQLFLGAEDVAWTGTQIFPAMGRGRTFRWLAFGFQQKRGPWSALVCKELQLQEITIILVPLLMLLHLALLAVRHFGPQWMGEETLRDTAVVVWMMASWVIGCVAVAEERRYNTLESLLCLPVRQRHQFAVKLAVVMALGTVVGGVFPWVLEHLDGANSGWTGLEPLIKLVLAAAVVTAIAFFASTMSRGMLQAFAVALLFSFLLYMTSVFLMQGIGSSYGWNDVQSPAAALFGLLIWPAMIAACIWLGYRNYKSLQTGWRLWAVNFAWLEAVFAAVLFVSCAGSALLRIYAR
jgi:ABC-type transport system involved in multi-copper enzyme maturation permease subunit